MIVIDATDANNQHIEAAMLSLITIAKNDCKIDIRGRF